MPEPEELPMWDRGHSFVGGQGAGSCLHIDQAWWSNIAKNFLGYKLVALWGPDEAEDVLNKHGGKLLRSPLSAEQCQALQKVSSVALLGPGDVASFTGGLPHATVVVGDELNVTAYESFINWHPNNAGLLLRGAERPPGREGAMTLRALHGLLDDVVEVVRRRVPSSCTSKAEAPDQSCCLGQQCSAGSCDVVTLRRAFRAALLLRRRCAKQLEGSDDEESSASTKSDNGEEQGRPSKRRKAERTSNFDDKGELSV